MEFIASVKVTFNNETGHRAVLHLRGAELQFAVPENIGPFSRLVEMMGATRYHTAWAAALEHRDVEWIGAVWADEVAGLIGYEVRP